MERNMYDHHHAISHECSTDVHYSPRLLRSSPSPVSGNELSPICCVKARPANGGQAT
jgi:hypothetical protein